MKDNYAYKRTRVKSYTETDKDTLIEFLIKKRKEAGVTKYRLSIVSGVDQASIGKLEHKKRFLSKESILKLTEALGITDEVFES